MPGERGDHSVAVIREGRALGESGRFESISVHGGFLLQKSAVRSRASSTMAISGALRHLCRSLAAITNDGQGPNFAGLS